MDIKNLVNLEVAIYNKARVERLHHLIDLGKPLQFEPIPSYFSPNVIA